MRLYVCGVIERATSTTTTKWPWLNENVTDGDDEEDADQPTEGSIKTANVLVSAMKARVWSHVVRKWQERRCQRYENYRS